MNFSVIITSSNEPETIGKALRQILTPNKQYWDNMEVIVVAPDTKTRLAAKREVEKTKFKNFKIVRDNNEGKPQALNLAVKKASGEVLILTDGDMYIDKKAISLLLPYFDNPLVGGVSGHPVPTNTDKSQFGFYAHVFTHAAHLKRLSGEYTHMSGYLYAIRNIKNLFPIPKDLRAEDSYISKVLVSKGYKIDYEPNALCFVSFPKNMSDWIKQKTRSLGGAVQVEKYIKNSKIGPRRSIFEDLMYFLIPFTLVKSPKQFLWALLLYPLRLYLWCRVYLQHLFGLYSKGKWERIESTKKAK